MDRALTVINNGDNNANGLRVSTGGNGSGADIRIISNNQSSATKDLLFLQTEIFTK